MRLYRLTTEPQSAANREETEGVGNLFLFVDENTGQVYALNEDRAGELDSSWRADDEG